jgi:hypothetical protein
MVSFYELKNQKNFLNLWGNAVPPHPLLRKQFAEIRIQKSGYSNIRARGNKTNPDEAVEVSGYAPVTVRTADVPPIAVPRAAANDAFTICFFLLAFFRMIWIGQV